MYLFTILLYSAQKYPTIYYIAANNKQLPVEYTAAHQAGEMIQYLFQHRSTPVGPGSDLFNAFYPTTTTTTNTKIRKTDDTL